MYCFKCGSLLRNGALFCGTVARYAEILPITPMIVVWIPLSNTLFVKKCQTVVHVLDACHDIQISLRTLKQKLKTMQLTKYPYTTDQAVRQTIKRKLQRPFAGHGYRFMWYKLKTTYGS